VNLFAKPSLGADAKAVADDQHAHHQLGIDRWAACVAVERRKVGTQFAELEEAINATQQVLARDVIVEVEQVEEPVLAAALLTHHRDVLP
jgi:hypothetical protein